MRKTSIVMAMAVGLLFTTVGVALGAVNPTPSTNDINDTNEWSHFEVLETRVGEVDVKLVVGTQTPRMTACFEYRSDDDEPLSLTHTWNPAIEDGLWEYECVYGEFWEGPSEKTLTLSALEYVEIRMVFGAEGDERFDWTRVEVLPAPPPGYHGLQNAASGPAGDHANENARFKQGNPKARFNRSDG